MTEHDWLAGDNPLALLQRLRTRSPSRLWLYACACCRLFPEVTGDPTLARALADAENCASGLLDRSELEKRWRGFAVPGAPLGARIAGKVLWWVLEAWRPGWTAWQAAVELSSLAPDEAARAFRESPTPVGRRAERRGAGRAKHACRRTLCCLVRDLFGNTLGPRSLSPAVMRWGNGQVRRIASAIHDDRRFDALGVLGDALEEAGCADGVILDHCRQPGRHALGCWVVDLARAAD
jgi:hypothetical protein